MCHEFGFREFPIFGTLIWVYVSSSVVITNDKAILEMWFDCESCLNVESNCFLFQALR